MKLCRGGCGNDAIFNDWCVEDYRKCSGYKKKLSDKAKLRGNNGVRGILSKKHFAVRPNEKEIFSLICTICGNTYEKKLMRGTVLYRPFIAVCFDCSKKKQSKSIIGAYRNKRKYKQYELQGPSYRKQICWDEQGQKCNCCGYNKYDLKTGPYDLHHIDGNKNNVSPMECIPEVADNERDGFGSSGIK
jgi:hypothetical protein